MIQVRIGGFGQMRGADQDSGAQGTSVLHPVASKVPDILYSLHQR